MNFLDPQAPRAPYDSLVQVHTAKDRWNYSLGGEASGRYVSMRGPLKAESPTERRKRQEAFFEPYPVVLCARRDRPLQPDSYAPRMHRVWTASTFPSDHTPARPTKHRTETPAPHGPRSRVLTSRSVHAPCVLRV